MNKSALKKFATEARKELLERVELQARKIGITAESVQKANVESSDAVFIDGRQLSDVERRQRNKLIARINEIGFERVMEETAYTWFNRFIALRFMEVNDYLPTKVRVLSSSNDNSAEPDMMREALSLDLDLDKEYVYELKMNNKTDELFKYLIKMHCNDLNRYMPFMFETLEDYKEILFPEGLLGTDSFVRQLTDTEVNPENNWEKIEVIGWLYQYYIADEKDRVIMAKKRYKDEEIPFATQLFTPDWIVRYMVQNALGRYWVESHPKHRDLIKNWEFYIENEEFRTVFDEKLIPYVNKELNVEDIKCFDPAMGSGHILIYMFEILYEIYIKCGYMEREIPKLIIEKNLYGLDIDNRAYQLACFALIMKALEYNKRFLRTIKNDGILLNLATFEETNSIKEEVFEYIAGESSGINYERIKGLIQLFYNAKVTGSLIKVDTFDEEFIAERLKLLQESPSNDLFEIEIKEISITLLKNIIKTAKIMCGTYDVLITNPPYMGSKYMSKDLSEFLELNYPRFKTDLYSSFIEYAITKTKSNGLIGMLTPYVWLYIKSFENLREFILNNTTIDSLIELEYNSFSEATVPVCSFVLRNYRIDLPGEYVRLASFPGVDIQKNKVLEAIENIEVDYRYSTNQKIYNNIKGFPIAFWLGENLGKAFINGNDISEFIDDLSSGNKTANNDRYLRYIWEVNKNAIDHKWIRYAKGGEYRKWYGNIWHVVDWSEEAHIFYDSNPSSSVVPKEYRFRNGITYTELTTRGFNGRLLEENTLFDMSGPSLLVEDEDKRIFLLALLNSKVSFTILKLLNSSFHIKLNDILRIPIIIPNEEETKEIMELAKDCVEISKWDWKGKETSLEFEKHPLICSKNSMSLIESNYDNLKNIMINNYFKIKSNEERINEIIISAYEVTSEILPKVEEKDISINLPDISRDIKGFISYVVGCSFGRYSLDEEGLIYAGGEFDASRYQIFPVDKENIMPILSGAYFEDDIVTRLVDFVRVIFSEDTLEENLDFIADAIGRKTNETAREALRRYFLNDFYKDHVQVYKKRPIYWLFTSGKEKAFNCLIYMHRYDKTTLSRIRTDYLHEVQIRMDAEKKDLLEIIEGDFTAKEISNAKRELKSLDKKIDELKAYDELLHHMADMQIEIDLDDGVKVNYEKFKGLVAKI